MTTRSSPVFLAVFSGVRVAIGPSLLAALGAATLAGGLLAVAPVLAVAAADDGARTAPAFTAGPLLAMLAVAPVMLSWVLALGGRLGPAAGVLAGLAALAPGRALLDLQLLVAPWRAARPELLVSTSLAPLRPGAAPWALLLGHLLTAAAGVLAVLAVRRVVEPPPAFPASDVLPAGFSAAAVPPRAGSPALAAVLCAGAVVAAGLVSAPYRSADPYLLPRSAVDAPPLVGLGLLALAAGVVVAACLAATAHDHGAGRGALLGIGLGVVAVALPAVLAAALSQPLTVTWGPFAALAGAAGLAGAVGLVGRRTAVASTELRLPALSRLNAAAGVLAVLAGVFALLGAAVDQVSVPAGLPEPVLYPARLLVPAGLVLAAIGAALLLGSRPAAGRSAAVARPALTVAWAGVALAGMAVLDAALTATQFGGVRAGVGVWATALALLLAPAAGCVAAVAGSVERDEVDLSELHAVPPVAACGLIAAGLAVPAFGLPLRTAPGYAEAGLWSNFEVGSWGLLAAVLAVVAAAMLAPWSRPSRAVGLLLGAATVLAVHLARLPLTGGRAGSAATVAAGTLVGLACLVVLLAGALLAWREHRLAPSTVLGEAN